RAERRGSGVGAADDGGGVAPRLPDAAPAARRRLVVGGQAERRRDGRRDAVDDHGLASARRVQHRLRLVRRQHHLLRADRPRRKVPPSSENDRAYRANAARMAANPGREAFPPATGGVPLAGWIEQGAAGEVFLTGAINPEALNKVFARGLRKFGDE